MDSLASIGSWISANESLLSGMAAMIVVLGAGSISLDHSEKQEGNY